MPHGRRDRQSRMALSAVAANSRHLSRHPGGGRPLVQFGLVLEFLDDLLAVAHERPALLDLAHARQVLGVTPHWALNTAVARTMNWYRQQRGGADARVLCLADIDAWEARP